MNSCVSIALLHLKQSASYQVCENKIVNVHQHHHSWNINPVKKELVRYVFTYMVSYILNLQKKNGDQ